MIDWKEKFFEEATARGNALLHIQDICLREIKSHGDCEAFASNIMRIISRARSTGKTEAV